jgi:hypothetical protein
MAVVIEKQKAALLNHTDNNKDYGHYPAVLNIM